MSRPLGSLLFLLLLGLGSPGVLVAQPGAAAGDHDLKLDPDNLFLIVDAVSLFDSGRGDEAVELLVKAARETDVGSRHLFMVAGGFQHLENAPALAIPVYRAILEREEHGEDATVSRGEVLGHLGLALNAVGRHQETVDELEASAREGMDDPNVYAALAAAYREFDDALNGSTVTLAALFMNPRNPDLWNALPPLSQLPSTPIFPFVEETLLNELVSHGQAEGWAYNSLSEIAATYLHSAEALQGRGLPRAADSVRLAYALGSWPILRDLLNRREPEKMLQFLSLVQGVLPPDEMEVPLHKSFYYHLVLAYSWLKEPLLSVQALEELAKAPENLLLIRDQASGTLVSHLVLKYLRIALERTWTSISWDPETHQLRDRDPRDFIGHFFRIEVDYETLDPSTVLTVYPQVPQVDPETGAEILIEKGPDAMIPYGMVSRSEDWATIGTCRKSRNLEDLAESDGNEEGLKWAEAMFCGGMTAFPSFLRGGPPLPEDPSYEALLASTLEQGDFELPLKDLLMALMETFDSIQFKETVEEVVPASRIEEFQQALSRVDPESIPSTTFEAWEITQRAWRILVELQERDGMGE